MIPRTDDTPPSIPLWFLFLLAAVWIFPGLIGHEPWKPDEAYSFGLVYHILQTGDLVVPMLAGEPFMEKPPLFYATSALSAKIFSGFMPLHDGARLASGFYIALTLLFIGLATRELFGRGRVAVLALLACLGIAPWAHLLITDTALLAGLALGLYGFALGLRRPIAGGLCLGSGAGIAFMSKGLLGPGLIGLTALALPLLHAGWRSRAYLISLLAAAVAALPWLLIWPAALYLRSPELFSTWLWDNNFGRFFGSSGLGPKSETFFYLRTLPWFAWPVWPLAAWTIWKAGRSTLNQPGLLLPLTFTAASLLTLLGAADARQVYALPLLLPLAMLAVYSVDSLSPRIMWPMIWLGIAIALATLLAIWGLWFSPTLLPSPAPSQLPKTSFANIIFATLLSIGGLLALHASRRWTARLLSIWAITMAMLVGLTLTLLLSAIDDQKSYRATLLTLRATLPASYDCVASEGLGEPQRAMVEYYVGTHTHRIEVRPNAKCQLLLRQERAGEPVTLDTRHWRVLWEGRRPGDAKEQFRLYQRL